ncbi:VOC family protein [Robertmurraya andreesenii]|uniref:PhnB protein n=1 Tax=Anoxybacillus andreesenii TaxID=1325932 RepID=A0ABT9VA56_9BACL|nr:VOC family protein [Robertmurraya andreesenii]MDQ0157814.1 PhnB protein [Robertmurraya andreesenii]
MAVEVYLVFNGNCREAIEFYAKVFKTETPQIMTFGESPQNPEFPLPEEAKNLVMHARLNIDGSNVMFSDNFPGQPYAIGDNVTLALISKNMEDLKSWYEQLKEGGTVGLELQETFWSKLYGQVTDKFGIQWQLNYDNGEMTM